MASTSHAHTPALLSTTGAAVQTTTTALRRRVGQQIAIPRIGLNDQQVKEDADYLAGKSAIFRQNFGDPSLAYLITPGSLLYHGQIYWTDDYITFEPIGIQHKHTGRIEQIDASGVCISFSFHFSLVLLLFTLFFCLFLMM